MKRGRRSCGYGIWYEHEYPGHPQLDFWPGWIPIEELEYGHGMGFYFTLSDDTLTLTDGGRQFLGYDFSVTFKPSGFR